MHTITILILNFSLLSLAIGLWLGYVLYSMSWRKPVVTFTGKPVGKGISLPPSLWDIIDEKVAQAGDDMVTRSSIIKEMIIKSI